jgi:hypothetical protein
MSLFLSAPTVQLNYPSARYSTHLSDCNRSFRTGITSNCNPSTIVYVWEGNTCVYC